MARDEAILEAVAAGRSPPTLRFYGWRGGWLSIGMAEPIGDVDRAAAASAGVGIVRRPSGGTAVRHEQQLGWSLTLPADHPLGTGDIVESYRLQSEITLAALRVLRVDARAATLAEARAPLPDPLLAIACFGGLAPHEIVVGDPPRKLVGWGQVRRRAVVMHHAVASLRFDARGLAALLNTNRARLSVALERRVIGLTEAAGREVASPELVEALVAAFALSSPVLSSDLTPEETARASQLASHKYATETWAARR